MRHHSSFWNIGDMQFLASSAAFNEPQAPDLVWNEHMTMLTYQSTVVNIATLRSGLHSLNDKLAQLLAELSGGALLSGNTSITIPDPMSKDDINYSFLNDPSLTQHPLEIVEQMLKNSDLNFIAMTDVSNQLILSMQKMTEILQKCAEINELIMILMHMVSSQPPRGSEEVDLRIRNGHRHRNIFLVFGEIWRVINATKTENITGHSTFIPSLPPLEIAQNLLYYLVHIRPLEVFLAGKVYDQPTQSLYHNFLYVQMGKRVTSDQLSKAMSDQTKKYCGASIGVSAWRHIAIALMRTFIDPSISPFKPAQNVGDSSGSHSTRVARAHYAKDEAYLANVSSDAMMEYKAFCKHWHAVLHFGDLPHPTLAWQPRSSPHVIGQGSTNDPSTSQISISEDITTAIGTILTELRQSRDEHKAMREENKTMGEEIRTMGEEMRIMKEENRTMQKCLAELLQEVKSLRTQRF